MAKSSKLSVSSLRADVMCLRLSRNHFLVLSKPSWGHFEGSSTLPLSFGVVSELAIPSWLELISEHVECFKRARYLKQRYRYAFNRIRTRSKQLNALGKSSNVLTSIPTRYMICMTCKVRGNVTQTAFHSDYHIPPTYTRARDNKCIYDADPSPHLCPSRKRD